MNIIAVDDEQHALNNIERAIISVVPNANLKCFNNASDAISYAKDNLIDIAFLDIEMSIINGINLAKKLKETYSNTNIIFVTGYGSYMGNAFDLHASGYVLKPINKEKLEKEINNLRTPIVNSNKGLYIQCFGNFEAFYDGKPLYFKRSKAKELLAYLIDRKGANSSKKELAAILLEDSPYNRSTQSYVQIITAELLRVLKEIDSDNILIIRHGQYAVDIAKVNCDYYDYEKGIVKALNSYKGEYMTNYSWAEFTAGFLANK